MTFEKLQPYRRLAGFLDSPPARAELLQRFVLEEDQFWTSEILIEALRHRARVVEVPVTIVARAGGESKKPASLRYGWSFSKVIVQTWLR